MTDPTAEFEAALEARVRAHLDTAVAGVDAPAVAAAVVVEAERAQPVGRPQVRWLASPPARWRPVAAVAAAVTVALGALLLGGAPDRRSPSPSPTSAVVGPSVDPSVGPDPSAPAAGLRRLNANGLLAWTEDGSLRVIAPDGSGFQVLDGLPGSEQGAAWSPDGRWIAFANDDGATGRLGITLADGSDPQILVETDGAIRDPVWSPDGAFIAYSSGSLRAPQIEVLHLATRRTSVVADGRDPAWAPDSRRLVFAVGRLETRIAGAEIGGEVTFLTSGGNDGSPDWSPLGDLIVFARQGPDGRGLIMAIAPDGGDPTPLTEPAEGSDSQPAFEPFGRQVAFSREFVQFGGDPSRGFVVEVIGGAAREVYGSGWAGRAWSPDGRLLVADGQAALAIRRWRVIVDVATGEEAHRFEPSEEMSPPSWQPLPYSVSCGPVDDVGCRDLAIGIVANAMAQFPGKRVLRVEIESVDGGYSLSFTDGTAIGADIN